MSVTTINLEMDTEQMRKIFGMQDAYIKKLEQDFQVTIVDRNGSIIITGEEENAGKASRVLRQLTALFLLDGVSASLSLATVRLVKLLSLSTL